MFFIVRFFSRKMAFWYRMELTKKDEDSGFKRDMKSVFVFSQTPVFPPSVWQHLGKLYVKSYNAQIIGLCFPLEFFSHWVD